MRLYKYISSDKKGNNTDKGKYIEDVQIIIPKNRSISSLCYWDEFLVVAAGSSLFYYDVVADKIINMEINQEPVFKGLITAINIYRDKNSIYVITNILEIAVLRLVAATEEENKKNKNQPVFKLKNYVFKPYIVNIYEPIVVMHETLINFIGYIHNAKNSKMWIYTTDEEGRLIIWDYDE